MSIFNNEDQAAILNPEDLIGEGKKYATQDEANKALAHSQAYIKKLESEHEEMRAEIAANERLEQLLGKVNAPATVPPVVTPPVVEPPANQEIDLGERIRQELDKADVSRRTAANVNAVADKVVELLGSPDKAKSYIEDKARELGVGVEFLQDVAARSPTAFFKTVGLDAQATPTTNASHSDVNPVSFASANTIKPNTYAWYENLRQTDKKAYFSPKIQQQMMKEALEKGDSFFA